MAIKIEHIEHLEELEVLSEEELQGVVGGQVSIGSLTIDFLEQLISVIQQFLTVVGPSDPASPAPSVPSVPEAPAEQTS